MIDVLRIAHLRIAPQEGNSEVGNCEVHLHCKAQGRWAFARGWLFVCGLAANVCLGVVLYLLSHIILWEL